VGAESDAEVIARSMVEAERFAAIFDRHFARVHRFFAWRVGPDAADDLAGEVFRVAFERRAAYATDRPDCLPWLYGIAANLLRHRHRSGGRESRALARDVVASVTGGDDLADDVAARVDAARRSDELARLLDTLTEGERDVVLLAAWECLTYEQLADALGVPVGTVRSRLHRARRKIRERLDAPADARTRPIPIRRSAP
jgi:RNA polymerase sigma factor (sigma-70 family)